jgi:sulfane dehydrogenase subunit SoxC
MPNTKKPSSRRAFIQKTIAISSGVGGLFTSKISSAEHISTEVLEVDPWTKSQGTGFLTPPYGMPAKYEKDIVRILPSPTPSFPTASRTPLQSLYGIITPSGLVFERHHAGVPDIDPDLHRLVIHGLVERPMIFTMEDIVRFPSESKIHFLECSGNSAAELKKASRQTVQQIHGLISCCEWTGVRLSTILQECRIHPDARWALAEGADGAALSRSIPMKKLLDDALLVYAQNGEKLRPEQGYPLRLFLPGFEGNMSIKWLRRIKLGKEPWQTREETSTYTDLLSDGKALQFTFTMGVKSVITQPSALMKLKSKGFYEISGLAWSGSGKIKHVEVSTNGGKSWEQAILQEPILDKALVRFRYPWIWEGAPATLMSRATDSMGNLQPTLEHVLTSRSSNSYYHNNAIQPWMVDVNGDVTNGR